MAHLRIRGIALDLTRLNEEMLELESARYTRAVPSTTSLGNSGVYLDASLPEIASVDRGIPLAIRARTFASIDAATEVVGDKAPVYGSSLFAIEPTFLKDAKVAVARNWNNSSRERFGALNAERMWPGSSGLDDFSQLDADEHGGTRSRSNSTLDWNAAPAGTVPHMSATSAVTRNTRLRTSPSPAAPPPSSDSQSSDSLRYALAALAEAYAAERKRNEVLESALSQRLLPVGGRSSGPQTSPASDAAAAALSATSAVESAVAAIQAMARAAGDSLMSPGQGRRHLSYFPAPPREEEEEEEEHESAVQLAEQVAATVHAAARPLPRQYTVPAPTPSLPATPAQASLPPPLSSTPAPSLPDGGASAGGAGVGGTVRRMVRRDPHPASLPLLSPHARHTAAAAAAPPVQTPPAVQVDEAAAAVLPPTTPTPSPGLPEADKVLLITVLAELERLKGELAAQEEAMVVQQALLAQAQAQERSAVSSATLLSPPASPPAVVVPPTAPAQEARGEVVAAVSETEGGLAEGMHAGESAAPPSLGSPTAAHAVHGVVVVVGQGVDPFYSPAKGAPSPPPPPHAQGQGQEGGNVGTSSTGALARPPSASSWAETVEAEILKVMAPSPTPSPPVPAPVPAQPAPLPVEAAVPPEAVEDALPCLHAGSSTPPPPALEAPQPGQGGTASTGQGEQHEGGGQDSGVRQLTLLSPAPMLSIPVDSGAGVGLLAAPTAPASPATPPSPSTPTPTVAADPSLHSVPLPQGDNQGTEAAALPLEQLTLLAPSPQPVPSAAVASAHQAPAPTTVAAVVDPQPQAAAHEEVHARKEEDAVEPDSEAPEQTAVVATAASPAPAPLPPPPPPYNVQAIRAFVLQLLQGHVFVKHGRRGWPHKRLLWLDATGAELGFRWGPPALGQAVLQQEEHWMSLGDVREVVTGRATPVLQRSGKAARADLYLSIVGSKRSVDLEAESKGERDGVAAMLQLLMKQPGLLQQAMVDLFTSGQWRPAGMEPAGEEE